MTSYSVKNPTVSRAPRVGRTPATEPNQVTAQRKAPSDAAPTRSGPRWTSRAWSAIRSAIYGFDAAALITHGAKVPPDHPARNPAAGHSFDVDE